MREDTGEAGPIPSSNFERIGKESYTVDAASVTTEAGLKAHSRWSINTC